MDELILRSLQGRTTAEQEDELRRWRAVSPEHEARYRAIAEVWQRTAAAQPDQRRRRAPTLAELEARAHAERLPARTGARRSAGQVLRWAAVIVLSLGLGFWSGHGLTSDGESAQGQVTEVITTAGEMATTILPDGSVLRVAPRTRIRALISGNERTVHVDGRAFLSVSPDSARPMRVHTPGGEATVRGTRFEIDARDPMELRLLVVEGRVSLRGGDEATDVRAGQLGTARTDGPPQVEAVHDPEARLSWMGNFVAFESTPLSQVARELGWKIGVPIRITEPGLARRTVTGSYTEEDMAYVLESVCRAAAVLCRMERDTVFIQSPEERQP